MTDQSSAPTAPPPAPAAPKTRTLLGLASLSGTIWVGVGSVLLGASGYAFLTLTAKIVPKADFPSLASLYLLVAMVGPALFIPVEQETTRLISRWQVVGDGSRDLIRQLGRTSAAMAAVAVVLLLGAGPFLVSRVFHGNVSLLVALIASVAGYGGACVLRGVFAGQRRLREYGVLVGVDGLVRLVPCLVLFVLGERSAMPYALALGFGSVAAFAVGLWWLRPGSNGPVAVRRDLLTAIGWLVGAWGASFALANIAPVIVTALLPREEGLRAGVFAFAFVVARVPVFVLLSLQAILLPSLSRSAATRDLVGLRRGIRQAMIVVGALGVIALVATAPLGRLLIKWLFHSTETSVLTLTLLAVGTILAMVIQVLQPALIAVAGHRVVAAAWLVGVVIFGACFALPLDPVAAATLAQVLAAASTTAVMAVALLRHLRTADTAPVAV